MESSSTGNRTHGCRLCIPHQSPVSGHAARPYFVPPMRMQAEKALLEKGENKEYLPIEGLAAFRAATAELLLGPTHPAIKEVSLRAALI